MPRIATVLTVAVVTTGLPLEKLHAVELDWGLEAVAVSYFEEPPDLEGRNVVSVTGPLPYFNEREGAFPYAGIYVDQGPDGVRTIITAVDPVPSLPTYFWDGPGPDGQGTFWPATIDNGNVAFVGRAESPNPDLPPRTGIYLRSADGALRTVVDTETPLPQGGGTFGGLAAPSIDGDRIAFFDGEHIYVEEAGAIAPVVGPGAKLPFSQGDLLPPGAFVETTTTRTDPHGVMIDNGTITFRARGELLRGPDDPTGFSVRGVYTIDVVTGETEVVADNFLSVPGSEDTFEVFPHQPATHRGDVAFTAETSGGQEGVYRYVDGRLERVVEGRGVARQWPAIQYGNVAFTDGELFVKVSGTITEVADIERAVAVARASDPAGVLGDLPSEAFDMPAIYHESLDANRVAFAIGTLSSVAGDTAHLLATLKGFEYADFSETSFLTLNGEAAQQGDRLRLTPDEPSTAGSAFFGVPFDLQPHLSFSTHFSFEIGGVNDGGANGSDGMAFVIHSDPAGASAIGNDGEGLGFGINNTIPMPVDPISPSVAIEFDTHQNIFDANDNHVAIILNGDVSNHFVVDLDVPLLNSGDSLFAWILYNGRTDLFQLFLSEDEMMPDAPTLVATLDLPSLLGEEMFFGFTAGTGDGFNYHEVLSWQLHIPEPATIATLAVGIAGLGFAIGRKRGIGAGA